MLFLAIRLFVLAFIERRLEMHRTLINGLPKLKYIFRFAYTAESGMHFPLHHHPELTELLFISDGRAKYNIDGKDYEAERNAFVLFQQGIWHEEWSLPGKSVEFFCMGFSGLQLAGLPENFILERTKPAVVMLPTFTTEAARIIRDIHREANSSAPESAFIADQQLAVLLSYLCRHLHYLPEAEKKQRTHRTGSAALAQKFIAENYNKPLTLAHIARASWASPSYLSHFFKEETGLSPIQYVIRIRLDVAMHLLETTDDTVEQIAERVGYASTTSFHNVFKREHRISPGEYRRKSLE